MLTGKEDMLSAVYAGDGEVEKTLKTLRVALADQPDMPISTGVKVFHCRSRV